MDPAEVEPRDFRCGVAAATGMLNRFVVRFPRAPTLTVPASAFSFDSAFPGPGVLQHLERIHDAVEAAPDTQPVVFGHTDHRGSFAYNKHLADRRAKAVLALLTRDLALFDDVAERDGWSLRQYQAMLRGLGCNPGAIDGHAGAMTAEATACFQEEYNEDVFNEDKARAHPDLVLDGILGPRTQAALRDAYVAMSSADVARDRFRGPGFSGCSEFNPVSADDKLNRRVIVALFAAEDPRSQDFPCLEGDASVCPVDRSAGMRCEFYRRFVDEGERIPDYPHFFDFQWLREATGHAHLSALTDLPDGTPAQFTVHRCEGGVLTPPPNSSSHGERPSVGPVIGTVPGRIAGGVCFARWMPPSDFDPFKFEDWLVNFEVELRVFRLQKDQEPTARSLATAQGLLEADGFRPPVFVIDAGPHWGFSGPPGVRLNRVRFDDEPRAKGLAIASDGCFVCYSASGGKVDSDDELDIVALHVIERSIQTVGRGK